MYVHAEGRLAIVANAKRKASILRPARAILLKTQLKEAQSRRHENLYKRLYSGVSPGGLDR